MGRNSPISSCRQNSSCACAAQQWPVTVWVSHAYGVAAANGCGRERPMREHGVSAEEHRPESGVVGKGVVVSSPAPNVSFKYYLADRRAQTGRLHGAEISLDVSLTLAHPVREVWPIFADFNLWQGRFGFVWDGLPASNEDN